MERKGRMEQKEQTARTDRPDLVNRFVAKFIDFLIVWALSMILRPIGPLAGLTYILISDGAWAGRSAGKRLIGLKVVKRSTGRPCSIKDSILRNSTLGLVSLFAMVPIIGWVLLFTLGIVIVAFETYLIVTDENGTRVGDVLADTEVIEDLQGK